MKIDETQEKQLIVLGLLFVMAIVYLVVQLSGSGQTKPAPASKAASERAGTTSPAEETAQPEIILSAAEPLGGSRDPFAPQIGPKPVEQPKPTFTTPQTGRPTMPPLMAQLPPVPGQTGIGGARPSGAGQSAGTPSHNQEMVLSGVIRGARQNVAIVKIGGDRSAIVREGQFIDGKYKVESISSSGVKLSCDGQSVVLRLGGNQRGARL